MNRVIPIIARRLGILDTDISRIIIDGQEDIGKSQNITSLEIDYNKTLDELRMHKDDSLYVELETDLSIMRMEIWMEKSTKETIQYVSPLLSGDTPGIQTGVIASATLNKLIERLTGGGDEHCKCRT
jgi:hypothetical protein